MATSRIISKTIFRLLLASGFLSLINQVAPNESVVHLANWLLWFWAIAHLIDPIVTGCTLGFYKWRRAAAQRRLRSAAISKEIEPIPLSHWGLHD